MLGNRGNQLEGDAVEDGASGRVKGKVAFVTGAARGQASEEARYVTGMQLHVDAGGYLKWYEYHN